MATVVANSYNPRDWEVRTLESEGHYIGYKNTLEDILDLMIHRLKTKQNHKKKGVVFHVCHFCYSG